MNSRFKTNNLVAILIAILLIATGLVLAFMHRQSESNEKLGQLRVPAAVITEDTSSGTLEATQVIDT
jgi:hypothetical protein